MVRRVQGVVQRVRCDTCDLAFPTFVFSGDTDMATDGLIAVTEIASGLLALGAATAEEYSDGFAGARRLLADRVSRQLDHHMLAIDVARYEQRPGPGAGGSFRTFRRSYSDPEAIYVCPGCGGDARVQEQQSPDDFKRSGGELILVDGLAWE